MRFLPLHLLSVRAFLLGAMIVSAGTPAISHGGGTRASSLTCAELQGLVRSRGRATIRGTFGSRVYVASRSSCGPNQNAVGGYEISRDRAVCFVGLICESQRQDP